MIFFLYIKIMRFFPYFLSLCVALTVCLTGSSCNRKAGCPANEQLHTQSNRKGQLSTKRGSSNLFPKKMRKNRPD